MTQSRLPPRRSRAGQDTFAAAAVRLSRTLAIRWPTAMPLMIARSTPLQQRIEPAGRTSDNEPSPMRGVRRHAPGNVGNPRVIQAGVSLGKLTGNNSGEAGIRSRPCRQGLWSRPPRCLRRPGQCRLAPTSLFPAPAAIGPTISSKRANSMPPFSAPRSLIRVHRAMTEVAQLLQPHHKLHEPDILRRIKAASLFAMQGGDRVKTAKSRNDRDRSLPS